MTELADCDLLTAIFATIIGRERSANLILHPNNKEPAAAIIKIEPNLQTFLLFFADIAESLRIIQSFRNFSIFFERYNTAEFTRYMISYKK
jgi:hypothetical protein